MATDSSHRDSGHRNHNSGHKDSWIVFIRFWSQDSGINDSGHKHRGSGHKILVTGILDTGIVILVTGMATGYNSTGHGQQSVCVTLSLVGKIARNSFHKVFTISCHVVIAKQSFQWVSGKARKLSNSGHNFWKQLLSLCGDLLMFFIFSMRLESKSLYRTYIVFWPSLVSFLTGFDFNCTKLTFEQDRVKEKSI